MTSIKKIILSEIRFFLLDQWANMLMRQIVRCRNVRVQAAKVRNSAGQFFVVLYK